MVHVKLGITISQPLFSADVPLCFWHSLLLISHKIPSCSLICHHIPWYPMNLSHTIPYYSRISHAFSAMKSPCFGPHPSPSPSAAAIGSRSSVPCPPPRESSATRDFSILPRKRHNYHNWHNIWMWYNCRRNFRCQTSDKWSSSGRSQRREERVRRRKINVREKVEKLRNMVFFQCFVASEGPSTIFSSRGLCSRVSWVPSMWLISRLERDRQKRHNWWIWRGSRHKTHKSRNKHCCTMLWTGETHFNTQSKQDSINMLKVTRCQEPPEPTGLPLPLLLRLTRSFSNHISRLKIMARNSPKIEDINISHRYRYMYIYIYLLYLSINRLSLVGFKSDETKQNGSQDQLLSTSAGNCCQGLRRRAQHLRISDFADPSFDPDIDL